MLLLVGLVTDVVDASLDAVAEGTTSLEIVLAWDEEKYDRRGEKHTLPLAVSLLASAEASLPLPATVSET